MVKPTMWKPNPTTSRFRGPAALIAGLLAVALMAGCTGDSDSLQSANEAPEARLTASKDVAWNGEHIEFDGRESSDDDGNVTEWRFDFGDGTTVVVNDRDEAQVSHRYAQGGEYVVTLTVRDDGAEKAGSKTDTATAHVAVNERQELVAQVIYAAPGNGSQTAKYTQPFKGYEGLDRIELDASVQSNLPAGASEIQVSVFDPEGDLVDEETVTVSAGENKTVEFSAMASGEGTYKVVVEAESGGATVHGEIRTYYDEGFLE